MAKNKGIKYIKALLFRGTATLLTIILLMVSGIEAFHQHSTHIPLEKEAEGNYPKQELSKAPDSCQICMYLSVQQIQISDTFSSLCLLASSTYAVKINTGYVINLFSTEVNSWTNKGPPVSF